VMVLVPFVAPKLVPAIVTDPPTSPLVGERVVMFGGTVTVKGTPLLDTPFRVTTTLPVPAPAGTVATMLVPDQVVVAATVPSKVIVLVPFVAPKAVPVTVTDAPTGPLVGETAVIAGVGNTVNATPALAIPPTLTTTLPVPAPAGTVATMLVADQLVVAAVVPSKVMVLVPFVAPKLVPVTVTDAPTGPLVGDKAVMVGGGVDAGTSKKISVEFGLVNPEVLYA
jgi:hypothetical protein